MFELPKGWEWKTIGEMCQVKGGKRVPKGTPFSDTKTNRPYLRVTDMINKSIKQNDLKYISEDTFQKIKRYTISKEDVYITIAGTIGLCGIIPDGLDGASLTENAAKLVINDKSQLDKKYLTYTMSCSYVQEQIKTLIGIVGVPKLALFRIEKIRIPIPSLPIQKHIVSILERAERLKEKRQEANDDTNKIIQSIFYEMFGDPVKNEKGFDTKLLNDVCDKITDGTHVTPTYVEKGVPFLRVTDLTNSNDSKKFISEEEHMQFTKRCKPVNGDVLYSKNGTIGIAKMVDWDFEFSIFVSLCLLKPNKQIMRSRYLEAFLNTPFALEQAKLHSKKGTITNLHLIEIKQIIIPVPSLEEQDNFIERLDALNKIQKKQSDSTTKIGILFDALIQKAFAGELVS